MGNFLSFGVGTAVGGEGLNMVAYIAIAIIIVVVIGKYTWDSYKSGKSRVVSVLDGTKNARKRMIVVQDPKRYGAKTLMRSEGELAGLEFGYSFWMYIDDWSYKYGEWKHVMHKGNESGQPLQCPGVWLHPKTNEMRVRMNTYEQIEEYVDIPDMPLNKWFHVVVGVQGLALDIYVNGNLAKRKILSSLPKQNYGDLYLNNNRGFSGYVSNVMYYRYYPTISNIQGELEKGPSKMPCVDSNEIPPYLSTNWWLTK